MDKTHQESENNVQQEIDRSTHKIASQAYTDLSQRPNLKIRLLAGLIVVVCAAVAVVHWPALSARALPFDDHMYLTDNLLVQNPSWTSAWRFGTEVLEPSTVRGYYQPLTMLSLMIDYALGGRVDNLRQFRRTSLTLHMANTALMIVLLYLLFENVWAAAAAGLLFGVHPMTVEPVPWVADRKTLLAAFFALWSLVLYVRFTRRRGWRLYTGCMVMYVLALLSKPTSVPVPALMLLMDFWPLRHLKWRAVLEKLPLFAVGAVSAAITYVSQSRVAFTTPPGEYGPLFVPLIFCHNIIFYPFKIILPVNLSPYYAIPEPLGFSDPMVAAGVIGTCILIPLLVVSLRWTRALLTGWLVFLTAIFPTMGVIGFTIVVAADKYVYLPSVGLLMVLAAFLGWLLRSSRLVRRQAAVVILVLILAGSEAAATRRYLVHWRSSESLFKYMLTLTPNASGVHHNLGTALHSEGRLEEAISHYRRAIELQPNNAEAYNNLGGVLAEQGKLDEAISCFRESIQIAPHLAEAHSSLGYLLALQGKFDEAVPHYTEAVRIRPDLAEVHSNLGYILMRQGRLDEAVIHFNKALAIRPNLAEAHNNLGIIFEAQGQFRDAMSCFYQASKIKPDWAAPLNAMVRILATQPDPDLLIIRSVIRLAEHAAKLTKYQDPTILQPLAASYAAAGQFDRAEATAEKALALALKAQVNDLAEQIRSQLQLYRQTKSEHK